jgi:hypothetical protein
MLGVTHCFKVLIVYNFRMEDKMLLKDLLFNEIQVRRIAGEIQREFSEFKTDVFVKKVLGRFKEL